MRWIALLLLLTGCQEHENKLFLFMWSDFISKEVIVAFEEEYGCKVFVDSYDSNESMYAKIRQGGTGYDLIFPSLYFDEVMASQGLIDPIDLSMVPNRNMIDYSLLKSMKIIPSKTTIPYMVSYTGIGFRKDRLDFEPNSWSIFADTSLKGRMTMLNDLREVFGAALLQLGYSINTVDPKEIGEAEALLLSWKPNLAKFESEQYKNGIASAEYLVVHGYSGDLFQVMNEDSDVEFIIPKEGGVVNCEGIALVHNDRPKELAYLFINYLLRPDVAIKNMEKTQALAPNKEAIRQLPAPIKNRLLPSEELRNRSETIQDVGENLLLYITAWERLKEAD